MQETHKNGMLAALRAFVFAPLSRQLRVRAELEVNLEKERRLLEQRVQERTKELRQSEFALQNVMDDAVRSREKVQRACRSPSSRYAGPLKAARNHA